MKPVLILQHLSGDGPAYLGTWLREQGVPVDLRNTEGGDRFPGSLRNHSALAILGGEMSANDPLPSLRQAEALFLEAVREGVPTLGHCLGAQLMSRALGGQVGPSPAPEIGWQTLEVHRSAEAAAWFGPGLGPSLAVFHWHYETFSLPPGAVLLASTAACPHQAFAFGPHLAMQFHVEVDEEKLNRWSLDARDEVPHFRDAAAVFPRTVQTGEAMRAGAAAGLVAQQALARRVYRRWMHQARTD